MKTHWTKCLITFKWTNLICHNLETRESCPPKKKSLDCSCTGASLLPCLVVKIVYNCLDYSLKLKWDHTFLQLNYFQLKF